MLSTAFPSILTAAPGEIQAEGLPNLRHLVVFDDIAASVPGKGAGSNKPSGLKPWQDTKAAIDFREIFLWNENGQEAREVDQLRKSLDKDEVMNLQFTR